MIDATKAVASEPPIGAPTPQVTVIVVSDYAGGETKSWADIRATLSGLARQDFAGVAEFVLVESRDLAGGIPGDLVEVLPGLRIEVAPVEQGYGASYLLKNHGVVHARSELVAVLDADCIPAPGWLSAAVAAIESRPRAAAVSGQTVYAGRGLSERILAVLSRAYLDRRGGGETPFVSNNNAVFRRRAFLAHPLPTAGGPFAARLQSEALRSAGYELAFEPAMRVTHDFEGWGMEKDIRRNIGWATIRVRQLDPAMPQAWATRLGPLAVPLFVGGHILDSWWHVLRAGRHYGLCWYEMPLAMATALYVHGMETGGMVTALAGRELGPTAYR